MTTFVMRNYKRRTIHGAHSTGPLEIRGHFHLQGNQPIDNDGGVPQWVADYLEQHTDVTSIAISGKHYSVVWTRVERP